MSHLVRSSLLPLGLLHHRIAIPTGIISEMNQTRARDFLSDRFEALTACEMCRSVWSLYEFSTSHLRITF